MSHSSPPLDTIGIDLVEIKKAKSFYTRHQSYLRRFFSEEEVSAIQKFYPPHKKLALYLAAKEAIFKASKSAWMGREGFSHIRILDKGKGQLSFKLFGQFKNKLNENNMVVSYKSNNRFVVASCQPGQ